MSLSNMYLLPNMYWATRGTLTSCHQLLQSLVASHLVAHNSTIRPIVRSKMEGSNHFCQSKEMLPLKAEWSSTAGESPNPHSLQLMTAMTAAQQPEQKDAVQLCQSHKQTTGMDNYWHRPGFKYILIGNVYVLSCCGWWVLPFYIMMKND